MTSRRSIHTIIHSKLRHILLVTLSVAAVLLLIYAVISFKQTENQAARFVMNHVERLAQAGVTSQNIEEVDTEIAEFAQTWKETQSIDLRINTFLDGKLISHDGQLQPFSGISANMEKKISLPSGEVLTVQIQMNLTPFILSSALMLIGLELAILALFHILSQSMQTTLRTVTSPLESKIGWLKEIANDLPESARKGTRLGPTNISEIDDLGSSISSLTKEIVALEDNLASINYERGQLKMAEHVAHCMKGVIATLQLKAAKLPAENAGLLDCIKTLSEISGDLINSEKIHATGISNKKSEPSHVLPVVRAAIASKQEQYRDNSKVKIILLGQASALGRFTRLGGSGLHGILFNTIDNAVEALGSTGGVVEIKIDSTDQYLAISVCDNGVGIPKHVMPSLMTEGFSYGKSDGNGLGLFHVKEMLEAVNGSVTIGSEEGSGTSVEMKIPLVKRSEGDLQSISIPKGTTVVCVDDDPLIHTVLDSRLRELLPTLKAVVHLNSVCDFKEWTKKHGPGDFGSHLYLFDFDLKDKEKTGLDLISDYGLGLESILVSGMTGDESVRVRASSMGVRWLSKDFLDVVPILVHEAG